MTMKPLKKHPKQQRMEEMTFPLHKEKGNTLTLDKLEVMEKDMRKGFKNESWEVKDDQYQGCSKRTWTKVKPDKWSFLSSSFTPGTCWYHPTRPAVVMSGTLAYNLCQSCLDRERKVTMTGREYLRSINDDLGFTLMPRLVWRVVAVGVLVGAVIYFLSKAI